MDRWVGKVAVVTGASVGIGAAIAEKLVKHGMKVVGGARNVDKIQELAKSLKEEKGTLLPVKCDVRLEGDVVAMFERARQDFGQVDVCINNAGLTNDAPILTGQIELWREMMEVNVLGLTLCTREAAKCFTELDIKDGHIININAGYGHHVPHKPALNFYAATKYAVTALTEATRSELRERNCNARVTDISPAMTESEFLPRMMKLSEEQGKNFYAQHSCLSGSDVADAVVYVLSAPSNVQVRDLYLSHTNA